MPKLECQRRTELMRTLGTRRTFLVAGAAAVAAVALAGCSAGQVAETSLKRPSNMGVNSQNSNNTVLIRNLAVPYDGIAGYPVDKPVPLQLSLFNQSAEEVRVTITSSRPADGTNDKGVTVGTSVNLVGDAPSASDSPTPTDSASPTPTPTGSASPTPTASAPAGQSAVITLPPMGSATFLPGGPRSLQVSGLATALAPGSSVYVTFAFSNGAEPLTLPAAIGTPTEPASRAPGIDDENSEG
jgi:hypothetical protein